MGKELNPTELFAVLVFSFFAGKELKDAEISG
jgi:hypothetical protein